MKVPEKLRAAIPEPLKAVLRPFLYAFVDKYKSELKFWKSRHAIDNGVFKHDHFRRIMLAMAQEPDDGFLSGKTVADFGCGPRGSLVWARSAALRIGIDVLADRYADEFTSNIISHDMIYLKSTEKVIPLPSNFVDVMFTLNAIDHVDSFPTMCREILRILKPGGTLIGSFNLEDHATACEPQALNEAIIKEHLLRHMEIQSYRISTGGPTSGPPDVIYAPFFKGEFNHQPGASGFLWVRAKYVPPQ